MSEFSEAQKTYMNALFNKISETFNKKTAEISKDLKSQIAEIKLDINNIVETYENKVKYLEQQNKQLIDDVTYLQRKTRKNNLLVFGIKPQEETVWGATINFFNNILEIDACERDFNDIYKIGKNNSSPVLVEFVSYRKKLQALKNGYKLKGRNIYISQDLSPVDRLNHKILVKHMQEAKNKGLRSYIKGHKLVIGDETYSINQLSHPNSYHSQNQERTAQNTEEDLQNIEGTKKSDSAPATPDPLKRYKHILEEFGTSSQADLQDICITPTEPKKPRATTIKTRSNSTTVDRETKKAKC